ncbi:hypothetical protein I4F81_003697 [Pyropia yezoensis]|uniref:Uncharacterized protein n=1 Tax=Pyropia yezoensis TaxID=2788 RepID=A0ACC3BT70_PYRYE|nr:hypothetical protein I4F81_003697 [Neopyropia yezoensis]
MEDVAGPIQGDISSAGVENRAQVGTETDLGEALSGGAEGIAVPPTAPVETADGTRPPVPHVPVELNEAVYCASDAADSDDTDDLFPMGCSDEEHPDSVPHDVSFGYEPPPMAVPPLVHVDDGDIGELYSYFLVYGQATVGDMGYDITRTMHNACTRFENLPSLTTLRYKTLPRLKSAWYLPTTGINVPKRNGGFLELPCVLPSTHVARDMAFKDTFVHFSFLDDRPITAEGLEPEFCDTPFWADRIAAMAGSPTLTQFSLQRQLFLAGDRVDDLLSDGSILQDLTIGSGLFADQSAGVAPDDEVHAGDFLCDLRVKVQLRGFFKYAFGVCRTT